MNKFLSGFCITCLALLSACGGGSKPDIKLIPVRSGNDYGYMNDEGKILINPQFSVASLFNNGIALVQTSGDKRLYGYINEDGKYVINPVYIQATAFDGDVAMVVAENEAPKGINKKGETVFTLKDAASASGFKEGIAGYATQDDKGLHWGFVNAKGEKVINAQFRQVSYFRDGRCAVRNEDGKWGYIDKTGKFLINPQFDVAEAFLNGKAIVRLGNKAGVIDQSGQYIINAQFDGMLPDGDKYLIISGSRTGWADKEGKIIINPQFEDAMPFNGSSLAAVKSGGNWGYVDDDGKIQINPQFDLAFPFIGGKAFVSSGGRIGVIDQSGKYLVNPQFDNLGGDYRAYVLNQSWMGIVTSDYFDLDAIIARIKRDIAPNNVAGFDFKTQVSVMMSKYNTPESNFNYYSSQNYLFKDEQITRDASVSLSIGGTIYHYANYSYNYKIDPGATVSEFVYTLNTTGKAAQKEDKILKALEGGFSGYTKISTPTEGIYQFASNAQLITVGRYNYRLGVKITPYTPAPGTGKDSVMVDTAK